MSAEASRLIPLEGSWSQRGDRFKAHVCNCIGCCRLCGSCRTWPGHTNDYCALLQRQAKEREAFHAE